MERNMDWAVFATRGMRESQVAEYALREHVSEVFFPRLFVATRNKKQRRPEIKEHSMFPGYGFIRSNETLQFHTIELLRQTAHVGYISQSDMDLITNQENRSLGHAQARVANPQHVRLKPGQSVGVVKGPMEGHEGEVKRVYGQMIEIELKKPGLFGLTSLKVTSDFVSEIDTN